jgi:hypothetical protein
MITVTVEKRYGASRATTLRARISAPTIERAVEMAGGSPSARLVLPIEAETFFAARRGYPALKEGIDFERMSPEELELAYEVGLPGAYEAYLDALRDDMGEDAFERYALENCLL